MHHIKVFIYVLVLVYKQSCEVGIIYLYHIDEENGAQNNEMTELEGSEQRFKSRSV